jgi:hypothetical protein
MNFVVKQDIVFWVEYKNNGLHEEPCKSCEYDDKFEVNTLIYPNYDNIKDKTEIK